MEESYLEKLLEKLRANRGIAQFLHSINKNWFTINEICTNVFTALAKILSKVSIRINSTNVGKKMQILKQINKKNSGTKLIISNKETDGIIKIVRVFEALDLLIKEVSDRTENEEKEQKSGFLKMSLGTLGACLSRKSLFNGICSRNKLPKTKGEVYVINFDDDK